MESICEQCRQKTLSATHHFQYSHLTVIETCSNCHAVTTTKYTVFVIFKQTVYENPKVNPILDHHEPNEHT